MSETTTSTVTVQHQEQTDGINLMEDESVLINRRPGWSLWWKAIGLAVLVLLGGVGGDAIVGGVVLAGIIAAYVVLSRMQSRYIVTDERVKAKVGLISSKTREYRIPDIQSITTEQSIFERILGHGSIMIRTASNDEIYWHGVPEYQEAANSIRESQRKYE
jgi:uncharacterized membrane protein YdbT with pleckstrin-like domain